MAWWKNKIILRVAITLVVAVSVVFAGFIVLLNMNLNSAVEQTTTKNGARIAEGFAASLNVPELEQFLLQPEENQTYWEYRRQLNTFREQIGAMYVYIVQFIEDKPYIIIDGQPEGSDVASPIMEETSIDDVHYQALLRGELAATDVTHDELYGVYISSFAPIMGKDGQLLAVLGIDYDVHEVQALAAQIKRDNNTVYLMFALVILLIISVMTAILVRTLRPLTWINDSARLIMDGQFQEADRILKEHPVRARNEIGQLYDTVNRMSSGITQMMRELVGSVRGSAEHLTGAVQLMEQKSDQLLKANQAVQQETAQVVQATDTQKRSSGELTHTMEEMSITISRISDASLSVAESSKVALDKAVEGREMISELRRQMERIADSHMEASEKMERLKQSSQRIDEAVNLITDVSNQTKLLALNAAIEAARAGEHGRGFAVVAGEVRKLADDVYSSASDIQSVLESVQNDIQSVYEQVSRSHEEVRQGEQMSEQVRQSMLQILQQFEHVSEQMEEISASTQEASAGSEQVTAAAGEISELAAASAVNAERIEKQAAAQDEIAHQVFEVSKQLSILTERLKEAISRIQV